MENSDNVYLSKPKLSGRIGRTDQSPKTTEVDGLVLGADTRATEGMIVADKNCSKIHYSLSTGHLPRVGTANRMLKQMLFRYQGHIGAALVLGGMDCNGPHLYSIYPHGSTDKLPYVTMGESAIGGSELYEYAKRLVRDAIAAGIFNDLGSGSNIDLCVITNGRVDYLRPHDMANKKGTVPLLVSMMFPW
uniref:Proteasome 20S subunit beta 7 n=1 Tax=Oncorhynchus kisutch TaxID=8019 RepID=A0A8C7N9R7_ONCKI